MVKYIIKDLFEFSDNELKECFSLMNSTRKEKVIRYKSELQKRCTLAGELLAKILLSEASSKSVNSFDIYPDEYGKLKQDNESGLYFNISHSETYVAAVVATEEIGIDIEVFRPFPLKLAKRICSKEELVYIFGHTPADSDYNQNKNDDCLRRFMEIWTAKEAYLKCTGKGITDLEKVKSLSVNFNKTKIITDKYVGHIVKGSDIKQIL